tara:strand:- start:897 stop:1058 length:162 start_codon:yes stop_codon:yes gene_type:complete
MIKWNPLLLAFHPLRLDLPSLMVFRARCGLVDIQLIKMIGNANKAMAEKGGKP